METYTNKKIRYTFKGIVCLVLCSLFLSCPCIVSGLMTATDDFAGTEVYAKSSAKPSAPEVTASINKSGSITLKWGSVNKAKGYIVYRKLEDSGSWKKLKALSKCTYTDQSEALKKASKVSYKVYAYSKSGKKTVKSKASNVITLELKKEEIRNKLLGRYKEMYPEKEIEVSVYDKFAIVNMDNVYINEQVPVIVSNIMDTIEEITGMPFYPADINRSIFTIVVQPRMFIRGEGAFIESAYPDGMNMYEEFGLLGELSFDYTTMVHELLHAVQLRNYADTGDILTEGFAESYTDTVSVILRDKFGYEYEDNAELDNEVACIECYGINELGITEEYNLNWLTKDNIEEYFFLNPAHQGHEPSYWIVEYIREKYGDAELYKLFKDATAALDKKLLKGEHIESLDNDSMLSIIRKNLSKKFVSEFYKWFTKTLIDYYKRDSVPDVSNTECIKVGYRIVVCYNGLPILDVPDTVIFKDSVTVDYSVAADYMEKYTGLKWKGIAGRFIYSGIIDFYDREGNLIYTAVDSYDDISVEGSVKCIFRAPEGSDPDAFQTAYIYGTDEYKVWYDEGVEEYVKTREYVRRAWND